MFRTARAGLCIAVLAVLPQAPALAQTMSAEEILKRIEAQRELKAKAAEEQRTRTLKFTGASNPTAPASTEAAAVVSTTPATPAAPAGTDTPPVVPSTETATLTSPGTGESPAVSALPGTATAPSLPGDTSLVPAAAVAETVPVYSNEVSIDLVVYFEFDSAILKPEARTQLDLLCTAFRQDTGTYQIIGHTDAAGSDAYNLRLSRARAEEVVRYLVRSCGIAEERMRALGLGEARLKDRADPEAPANRRVEIQVAS